MAAEETQVDFWWQSSIGTADGLTGKVFDPSPEAAEPTSDHMGAWHPYALVVVNPKKPPVVGWRRCFKVFDWETLSHEINSQMDNDDDDEP